MRESTHHQPGNRTGNYAFPGGLRSAKDIQTKIAGKAGAMGSCDRAMIPEDSIRQTRAAAHDLRNLFGIVACAAGLLEKAPDHEKLASISAALNRVALRGESICDAMLCRSPDPLTPLSDDFDGAITAAIPLVRPLLTQGISLISDLRAARAPMPLADDDIETILVELVSNAVRHGEGASRILVRSRSAAGRVWLIVADNGRGRLDRLRALHHGHGLLRLDVLVRRSGGDFQLRRTRGGGMVAGISFPVSAEPGSGLCETPQPPAKEKDREDRQPVAA